MNLSGNYIQKIVNYWDATNENLIVFSDNLVQELGNY